MDRHWLLTWTTYGTWLPGDARGFVSNVVDGPGPEVRHNVPGIPYDANDDRVRQRALDNTIGEPVWLTAEQATIALAQFRKTATYRDWSLLPAAVMSNHVHLVVGVLGDPDPAKMLHDFKSYATRALKAHGHLSVGGRWWTESGSRRKLPDDRAVRAAVAYVLRQRRPLVVWSREQHEHQGVDTPRSPEML